MQFEAAFAGDVPGFDAPQHATDGNFRLLFAGLGHDDQEFITAVTEQEIGAAEIVLQHLGHIDEDFVPGLVAEIRIYGAKAIEVDHQERQLSSLPVHAGHFAADKLIHGAAIEEIGERVVERKIFQTLVVDQFAN